VTRRPGVLVPCFAARSQISHEARRIAEVRAQPPAHKNETGGPRLMQLRGMADGPASHFSDRTWVDANGAVRPQAAFVRSEYAGSPWLGERDPERPGDY